MAEDKVGVIPKSHEKSERYSVEQMVNLQNRLKESRTFANNVSSGASSALSRMGFADSSVVGTRDYDTILGYCDADQSYRTYKNMYDRGDLAKRIVDAPVAAVWANPPAVKELDSDELDKISVLNTEWQSVYVDLNIGDAFRRADKMNRLGTFSIIYVGYDDGGKLSSPVKDGAKIKYLQPLSTDNVTIGKLVNNYKDSRNGKPEFYQISSFVEPSGETSDTRSAAATTAPKKENQTLIQVHHSRVIHIVEDNLDSNIEGIPIFTHVYNRLIDLIKIVGGSAEMFWLGARPGYAAIANPDTVVSQENYEEMEQMLEAFDNDMTRWIQTQGIDIKSLSPQVSSPKEHFGIIIACISAATAIPQRILTGAESGELASSQDKVNWETTIIERRTIFAEPKMLRPLIDMLQKSKQISTSAYEIVWADLATLSEKDKADTAYKLSQSVMALGLTPGMLELLGPKIIGDKILQLDEESVRDLTKRWDAGIAKLKEATKEPEAKAAVTEVKKNVFSGMFHKGEK